MEGKINNRHNERIYHSQLIRTLSVAFGGLGVFSARKKHARNKIWHYNLKRCPLTRLKTHDFQIQFTDPTLFCFIT